MNYQVIDNITSIKFFSENGVFLLMKEAVEQITVIREDIIKVSMGKCAGSIFFRHRDVSNPVTTNALELVQLINSMLAPIIETPPPTSD